VSLPRNLTSNLAIQLGPEDNLIRQDLAESYVVSRREVLRVLVRSLRALTYLEKLDNFNRWECRIRALGEM